MRCPLVTNINLILDLVIAIDQNIIEIRDIEVIKVFAESVINIVLKRNGPVI